MRSVMTMITTYNRHSTHTYEPGVVITERIQYIHVQQNDRSLVSHDRKGHKRTKVLYDIRLYGNINQH